MPGTEEVAEALAHADIQDDEAALDVNGDEGSPTADADAHGGDADAEAPSDQKVVAKFLVSNAAAGSVIGKGGATIRQFAEDSKAAIGLSPQDRMPPGVADRTVRITGEDLEQLMRATALILTKLSQNPNYSRFTSTSVSYGGYSAGFGGSYGGRAGAGGPPPEVFENGPQGEATVAVPDRAVGAIIGKGGEVINQIKNVVGVRIRVSGRDEYIEGTRDRSVTISGPKEGVAIAEQLIRKKMESALAGPGQRD